jgi:deoxyribonuclease-4
MTGRLNIGAHISISGGIDQAPLRGKAVGCECIQIFTKSNRQWRAKDLADDEVQRFQANCRGTGIGPVYAHNGYLINLGAAGAPLRRKSEKSFAVELERAEKLGLPCLIAHPGAHAGAGEKAIHRLLRDTQGYGVGILLETTAGGGSTLGGRFEHLAQVIGSVSEARRLGVCYDTCHTFAAGYDMRTPEAYRRTLEEFDDIVGLDRLKAFHVNDSLGGLGSHVDRHEHIGKGKLGPEPFRMILRDERFRAVPKFLETPKGMRGRREWDEINLEMLRKLASGA